MLPNLGPLYSSSLVSYLLTLKNVFAHVHLMSLLVQHF